MLGRQTVPESVCFFVGAWHRFLASGALVPLRNRDVRAAGPPNAIVGPAGSA